MLQKNLLDTHQTVIKDFTLGNGIGKEEGEGGRKEWGKTKLEVLRNWSHPKKYTSGEVSLTPPPQPQHELIASPASGCIIINLVWKQLKFCKQQIL